MKSPHIFLNLINQPRGRMMMEMYCGLLLLFINLSGLILLQKMLRSSLSQLWFRIKKRKAPQLIGYSEFELPSFYNKG